MVNFTSNDYLGISKHSELINTICDATNRYGVGSTGSRRLSGNHPLFKTCETEFSEWLNKDAGVLFNSGYQMNSAIFKSLFHKDTIIIADKLVHASLIDGILNSNCLLMRFKHNDYNHLELCLKKAVKQSSSIVIVCESVYSMDGDSPDLKKIVQLKQQYGALLMVDEAHSIGIFGQQGKGLCYSLGVLDDVDFLLLAFGKAFGCSGGMILAKQNHIEAVLATCRSYIYSTAMPLPMVAAISKARMLINDADDLRHQLINNISLFKRSIQSDDKNVWSNYKPIQSNSAIQPIVIGDKDIANHVSQSLIDLGSFIKAVHHPTVPKHQSRLRITLTVKHTKKNIQALSEQLTTILNDTHNNSSVKSIKVH